MIILRDIHRIISSYISKPEILVITGMRRTGKTTLLRAIYNQIKTQNKLFLDLENPLYQKYFEEEDFEKIKFNFELLGLNTNKPSYLFLDEIQFVKNLPQVVKYLFDHYQIKCILTGSSSFYLKNQFSESLVGRKYIFELYPLNFKEFLRFKGANFKLPSKKQHVSKALFQTLSRYYEEYLQFGGFPGVVLKDNFQEKKMALEDTFSSYFQLEIVQLSNFRKTKTIRDLMLLLMKRVGSKLDIQKISSELGISRPTLYEYLAFLEGTYFIHLVKPYSTNRDVELRGAEKVYVCDSGLLNQLAEVNEGILFENNIFQQLKLQGKINYYQSRGGTEIDFIVDKKVAYEVKLHPSIHDMRRLNRTRKQLKLREGFVISKTYSESQPFLYPFQLSD